MAKEGESIIDNHNDYIAKLNEFITAEIEKRKALMQQLDRIEKLLLEARECDIPVIVRENDELPNRG